MHEQLSNRLIGSRVKAAREAAGFNQEALARSLAINDRQTISDIENGKRRLQPDELVILSDVLDRDIEFFLDPFSVAGEAQFSWRASPTLPEKPLNDFEFRAGSWIGLLRWLREINAGRVNPLKHSLRLTAQSSFEEAITRAEDLANSLQLGKVPAEQLIEAIERKLDIPVLFVDTDVANGTGDISGATCHLTDLGVILINRNEGESRRNFDIAHELFHALTWDAIKPDHRESNSLDERGRTKRIEQLANSFASALLMPTSSLQQIIDQRRLSDLEHLTEASAALKVTPVALAWRLFNMKWIDAAMCAALKQVQLRPQTSVVPRRLSIGFINLLHAAIDKGKLSARRAAKALGMTLPQLADLFVEHAMVAPFEQ